LRDEGFGLVGESIVEADFHGGSSQRSGISRSVAFWDVKRNDDCIRGWRENKQPPMESYGSVSNNPTYKE
jgi:hypothetical protein